jgi:hypothetical protein
MYLDFVHRIAFKNEPFSITENFPNIGLKDGEAVPQSDPTEFFLSLNSGPQETDRRLPKCCVHFLVREDGISDAAFTI